MPFFYAVALVVDESGSTLHTFLNSVRIKYFDYALCRSCTAFISEAWLTFISNEIFINDNSLVVPHLLLNLEHIFTVIAAQNLDNYHHSCRSTLLWIFPTHWQTFFSLILLSPYLNDYSSENSLSASCSLATDIIWKVVFFGMSYLWSSYVNFVSTSQWKMKSW